MGIRANYRFTPLTYLNTSINFSLSCNSTNLLYPFKRHFRSIVGSLWQPLHKGITKPHLIEFVIDSKAFEKSANGYVYNGNFNNIEQFNGHIEKIEMVMEEE